MRRGELGILAPWDPEQGVGGERYIWKTLEGTDSAIGTIPDYAVVIFLETDPSPPYPSDDPNKAIRVVYGDLVGWIWGHLDSLVEEGANETR